MSKSKSKGDITKSTDIMKKVRDAAITKPAKAVKVPAKEEKKSKKVVKEPTPESSESEEETEASSDSEEESDEESPVVNGKTNGIKKPVADSDSDSASSKSSDDEAPTNGAKVDSDEESGSEEESGSDEDSESDEDTVVKNKAAVKAAELNKKLAPVKADESSDDSAADNDDSESSAEDSDASSDDSDEEEEEEEEEEVKTQPAKRKAEETESPFAKKTKLAESNGESQGSNLFVGNLSWNVDEEWLTSEFEKFGELSSVRIITDRETGRSKGFSYVEFTDAANAAKAHAEMQGHELDGRVLNVDFATQRTQGNGQDRSQARAKTYGDKESAPSDTLFVGNLSFDVGQDAVSAAFGEYGTIMGVRLPTDRETGQPKGFGYVTFSSVEEAKAALEAMQGYDLEGRAVRLDYSQPRPQNSDSPGRGRGGFGGGRGRGGFGDRGGRGGGRGRGGFGDRGGRGGRGGFSSRGGSTNRGGFGDYKGKKTTF